MKNPLPSTSPGYRTGKLRGVFGWIRVPLAPLCLQNFPRALRTTGPDHLCDFFLGPKFCDSEEKNKKGREGEGRRGGGGETNKQKKTPYLVSSIFFLCLASK